MLRYLKHVKSSANSPTATEHDLTISTILTEMKQTGTKTVGNLVNPLQNTWLVMLITATFALGGCASRQLITNVEDVSGGRSYQASYRDLDKTRDLSTHRPTQRLESEHCLPQPDVTHVHGPLLALMALSPGDLLEVSIGTDEYFSGRYEVSADGTVTIKSLSAIRAFGVSPERVGNEIAKHLVARGFYNTPPAVSVRIADFGAARVSVSGAVFEPGAVKVGGSAAADEDVTRETATGAATYGRRLSRAIQNAGGIRPDADLARVRLIRNGKHRMIDLRPALSGKNFEDPIMLEGDEIAVPSRNCFQQNLVVISAISPVGVKAFMSNLTVPAISNANSKIDKDTREMRYGTRMLQALVSMNCVGGTKFTNADRSAILYSRNPVSGESIVIERKIEDLVRHGDRDDYDPYIMPNDALACYDSRVIDIVDIARGFGIVAGTIVAGRGL
jgi:polysaccharide biosynthesis/export protein